MDQFAEVTLKIKESVDLVELIQEYIPLTRRGRSSVALCPFHAEKTPSFTVYSESQHYKCYGCGKAGDVFDFLKEKEGWSFREAAEALAEKAGISLQGVFRQAPGERGPRLDVHGTLGSVRDWFGEVLLSPEGEGVRNYLQSRGLFGMAERFGLGAPPAGAATLRQPARLPDLQIKVLEQAGLLSRGGQREPFAGRAMFPILDERGRVVGFGGRMLPDGDHPAPGRASPGPKYLNSPESPFFNKRRLLFGLRQAKDQGERRIIVVEGYTDVIACHQADLHGVVATLGTALTVDHARLLERYASDGVTLLFDGDRAGRQAAERAFRELVHTMLPVRIALLPEGSDPCEELALGPNRGEREREKGRNRLCALIDGAEDAVSMWFRLLRQRLDLDRDVDVQRAASECGRILAQIENLARREALQRAMARQLGTSEEALARSLPRQRIAKRSADLGAPRPKQGRADPMAVSDCELMACIFADVKLLEPALELRGGSAVLAEVQELISESGREQRSDANALAKYLFARCGEREQLRSFLSDSLDRAHRMRDAESIFLELQRGRRSYFAKEKVQRIRRNLQKAMAEGDQDLTDQLTRQYMAELRHKTSLNPN